MAYHIRRRFSLMVGLFVILAVPFLSGCRAEEQNRVIMFEPGVYKGKAPTALSSDQVRVLQYRVRFQSDQ